MKQRRDFGSVVFGLVIATVGALFLADNLGYVQAENYFAYWPVLFIALGFADLLRGRYFGAGIWILVGGVLLAGNLGYTDIAIWDLWGLWPLVLVVIGFNLMRQSLMVAPKDLRSDRASTFRAYALMGGNVRKFSSPKFLGGDMCAVMAGCEVDLRGAKLLDHEAVLDVLAFWGGIEIRVPETWEVVDQVAPILGGFDDKTMPVEKPTGRLIVRGTVAMGGVEVRN